MIGSQGPELGLLHDSRENSTAKKEEKIWKLFVKIYSNNILKKIVVKTGCGFTRAHDDNGGKWDGQPKKKKKENLR